MKCPPPVAAAVAALALAACHHDVDERLGLDEKRAPTDFDATALGRSGELERALSIPSAEVARKLGSYRLVQSVHYDLATAGGADTSGKDTLDETWRLEVDAKGGLHVLHDDSHDGSRDDLHDYGFEWFAVDGAFYVRPRYGRFVKRSPEGDEVERTRDEAEGVLPSFLSVLGRFAARRDEGQATIGGRPARKVTLSLAPSPSRLRDGDPAHAWRRGMKVSALSGEVVVDVASGAPLAASLDATWTAPRNLPADAPAGAKATGDESGAGKELTVHLSYKGGIEAIGEVPPIAAPADAVASPTRVRPLLDKQVLLDGLVTPATPAGEK